MLTIQILEEELFDNETQEFLEVVDEELELEHSLISLSKWESKFKKPFLSSEAKTTDEIMFYIECMVLTPGVGQDTLKKLSTEHFASINDYIESSESATTFGKMPPVRGRGETITAELIYFWMVAFNIPFECERWHLNRLFALIRICNIKNSPPKKMSKGELARRNHDLNEQRKAQLNTRG